MNLPEPNTRPSKIILKTVNKLRHDISRGRVEKRGDLCKQLAELMVAYAKELKFQESLDTFDEALQLAQTLAEEGQYEYYDDLGESVFPWMTTLRRTRSSSKKFDRFAFYERFMQGIKGFSEEKFLFLKAHYFSERCAQAVDIREAHDAPVQAISLLNQLIAEVEKYHDPNTTEFMERKSAINPFRARGLIKHEIGDKNGAIEDLKHYEALADKIPRGGRQYDFEPTVDESDGSEKYVLRVTQGDLLDFLAKYDFVDDYYEAMFRLANIYMEKADKDNALLYFDKALSVSEISEENATFQIHEFLTRIAPAEIPFRKAHIFMQFRENEEALRLYDLAIEELQTLLDNRDSEMEVARSYGNNQDFVEYLQERFSDYSRYRAECLQNLGRYDEANQAVRDANEYFAQMKMKSQTRFQQQRKEFQQSHDADTPKKGPQLEIPTKKKKKGDKKPSLSEQDILLHLGAKHNEAVMDLQRGYMELQRGHWRTSLKYCLKARLVLDSFGFMGIEEAQKNLCAIYSLIAMSYMHIGRFEDSEKWHHRAVTQTEKVIENGALEYSKELCAALESFGELYSLWSAADKDAGDAANKAVEYFRKAVSQRRKSIGELESEVQNIGREKLLQKDPQRLALLAERYIAQHDGLQLLEMELFHTGKFDDAVAAAREDVQTTDALRELLRDQFGGIEQNTYAVALMICLLLLNRQSHEAQQLFDARAEQIFHEQDVSDTPEISARDAANDLLLKCVYVQFIDLFSTDNTFEMMRRQCADAARSVVKEKSEKTREEAIAVFEELKKSVKTYGEKTTAVSAEDVTGILARFWTDLEEMLNTVTQRLENNEPIIPAKLEKESFVKRTIPDALFMTFPKRQTVNDPQDELEDFSMYERDFEKPTENYEAFFEMVDELTGESHAKERADLARSMDIDLTKYPWEQPGSNALLKVGRNDPCPCGSGKKYKKCCGKN